MATDPQTSGDSKSSGIALTSAQDAGEGPPCEPRSASDESGPARDDGWLNWVAMSCRGHSLSKPQLLGLPDFRSSSSAVAITDLDEVLLAK